MHFGHFELFMEGKLFLVGSRVTKLNTSLKNTVILVIVHNFQLFKQKITH